MSQTRPCCSCLKVVDIAEMAITSDATLIEGEGPADAFRLEDVKGVAVVFKPAEGRKCARSWKITPEVGTDKEFPDITPRDADAVREWQKRHRQEAFRVRFLGTAFGSGSRLRGPELRPRPGLQMVDAACLRHRCTRADRAVAFPRYRPRLEPRHFLWLVVGWRLDLARRADRAQLSPSAGVFGSGLPEPLAR